MNISKKVAKLCSKGLRFGGTLKIIKKYWEVRPSLVCLSCVRISHNRLKECTNRAIQCIICIGAHKVEDYIYRVIGGIIKMTKICTYVIPKYANCAAKYQAMASRYLARVKAQVGT